MNKKTKNYRDEITEKIIKSLEKGVGEWQKGWRIRYIPQNAVSGRAYSGINTLILGLKGSDFDNGVDPRWCTFQQAKQNDWHIKKGVTGTHIVFWKVFNEENDDVNEGKNENETKTFAIQKFFTVFHAAQIEGIPCYKPEIINEFTANENAERVLQNSGADIRYGGNKAFYRPNEDFIQLPLREDFYNAENFYSTALHELAHWSGGTKRLNRKINNHFGSDNYAFEELIAEIASIFLSIETGIQLDNEHFQNHATYISSWIKILKSDNNKIFKASAEAEKAVKFILKRGCDNED